MPTTTIMQTKAPINVSIISYSLILQEYGLFCRFASAAETDCIFGIHVHYNLGRNVGDKFTKLSKISFEMECFTADFL